MTSHKLQAKSVMVIIFCFMLTSVLWAEPLKLGVDCLIERNFNDLKDCGKIGVLTHAPATSSKNISTNDIFADANQDQQGNLFGRVSCFFSPEHGLTGCAKAGEAVKDDTYKGIKVHSLYKNNTKKIESAVFDNIDTSVIDLVDVGVRCYTYITCMRYTLETCLHLKKKVVILDRPNPLGRKISGALLEPQLQGYTGGFIIPFLHGMTMGELATMLIKNYQPHVDLPILNIPDSIVKDLGTPKCPLQIIKMENYNPDKYGVSRKNSQVSRGMPPRQTFLASKVCLGIVVQ